MPMGERGHAQRGEQRPRRLGQVVDVARGAGNVQRRAVVRERFADHRLRISRGETPSANLRSRFCAAVSRYQLEARWSESGLKSSASAAHAASTPLAYAASALRARAGVAAMPPKTKRGSPLAA